MDKPATPDDDRGDMAPDRFREAAHQVADQVADYLEGVEGYPVLPDLEPGFLRDRLPAAPPADPEAWERILADYRELIEPHITHWQHPGFMAYFASVASGPGILGEWLATGLNSNVMFWRNAPASTELEEVVVGWLVRMLGLPAAFDGMFTDTASVSTLLSVVAARHRIPGLEARRVGLTAGTATGRLRLYASAEAHSSVDKAAVVAGVGLEGVRRIPVDDRLRLRPDLLAAAIAEDRAAGWLPFVVVATAGTTSSTSVDPLAAVADICQTENIWLHVDGAYGGAAALCPELRERFAGWERADSIVVNPHKWLFTPFDASLLLFRDPETFKEAFSLVPEYLRTGVGDEVHNYHEYGIQLGRRFRALKLWFLIRYFGAEGMAARIRGHCALAREFAGWVEAEPGWEVLAPVPFSVVCFRHVPPGLEPEAVDAHNEALMARVNRSGRIFLSHTRLRGVYTIRLALGNLRAGREHVELAWRLLREAAKA